MKSDRKVLRDMAQLAQEGETPTEPPVRPPQPPDRQPRPPIEPPPDRPDNPGDVPIGDPPQRQPTRLHRKLDGSRLLLASDLSIRYRIYIEPEQNLRIPQSDCNLYTVLQDPQTRPTPYPLESACTRAI